MKTLFHALVCACTISAGVLGADFAGKSPSGKLAFSSKGGRQLFVWSTANPTVRMPVIPKGEFFEYMATMMEIRGAFISPDDTWLALEMRGREKPKTSDVLFLRRGKDLEFTFLPGQFLVETKSPWTDPAPTAAEMALKARGADGDDLDVLDHADLHALEWSADSKWIIVSLNANGVANGKHVRITDARFRFNPVTQVMEAEKSNPGKFQVEGGR